MTLSISAGDDVVRIRRAIDHPIVDADGHYIQFMPLIMDIVAEIAGPSVAARLAKHPPPGVGNGETHRYSSVGGHLPVRGYWGVPEKLTVDRMTATLPRLLYERLDEIGIDLAVLYPSAVRSDMDPDSEVRLAFCRAINIYAAEVYGPYKDRLLPAALIPMCTPEEAVAELRFAVGELGLRATMMESAIPRVQRPDGTNVPWVDTLGHDSLFDYDPVWAACEELRVVPAFHGAGFGWGSRVSSKNYVHNHLGCFSAAQEGVCRSLVMGGVPKRFPNLRFAFLEGGIAWACELYASLIGHYAKRNKDAVRNYDPAQFDLDGGLRLFDEFAEGRIAQRRAAWEATARHESTSPIAGSKDDFAEALIDGPRDVADIFERQFFFGCEADDPLTSLAFDARLLPGGVRLNPLFSSDISHWDVPDMRGVLPEAWELVEDGHLTPDDFREFTYGSISRMVMATNPEFFAGTVLAT